MPWLETAPVEQRQQFIEDYQQGFYSMSELCARYGISRKTGDKWLERFADGGRPGLADPSRAPHTCPQLAPSAAAIVSEREDVVGDLRVIRTEYLVAHAEPFPDEFRHEWIFGRVLVLAIR